MFGCAFGFTLPTLYTIFILSPTPFPFCFNFVLFYEITEFELDLYVWDFQLVKSGKNPGFLFICSLASINFTSTSSTQIPISKSLAIKDLALQQVQISTHFIPTNHNDLLISEPSDHTMLVYLELIAILIATTSSWYFPHPYWYPPFLFQNYQQIVNTAFLKAEIQKILSLSEN